MKNNNEFLKAHAAHILNSVKYLPSVGDMKSFSTQRRNTPEYNGVKGFVVNERDDGTKTVYITGSKSSMMSAGRALAMLRNYRERHTGKTVQGARVVQMYGQKGQPDILIQSGTPYVWDGLKYRKSRAPLAEVRKGVLVPSKYLFLSWFLNPEVEVVIKTNASAQQIENYVVTGFISKSARMLNLTEPGACEVTNIAKVHCNRVGYVRTNSPEAARARATT